MGFLAALRPFAAKSSLCALAARNPDPHFGLNFAEKLFLDRVVGWTCRSFMPLL